MKQPAHLFQALELALQEASRPLNCHDLFAFPEVKRFATSPNRVSDYLGGLWRKGLVTRLPDSKSGDGRTRWRYQWKDGGKGLGESNVNKGQVVNDRPSVVISEDGMIVTIELPNIVISIRQKHMGLST